MKLKHYLEYKDSGVEWIGEIPKEWDIKKLDYYSEITPGHPFNSDFFSDEGIPLIRIRDLANVETVVKWPNKIIKDALIEKNDILVGMDGDFDVVVWKGEQALLNQRIFKIDSKNQLKKEYLKYFLNFPMKQINKITMSTTVKHLAISDVKKVEFPFPKIDEQKQISSFLDKKTSEIDLTIEKDTRLIELLKEKRTALINHLVTKGLDPTAEMKDSGVEWIGKIPAEWEVKKLKHIIKPSGLIRGPFGSSIKTEFFVNKGYKVYEQKNSIKNDPLIGSSYVDEDKYNELIRFSVKENDILMSCSGTIGKIVKIPPDYEPGIINQALLIMRFTNEIQISFFEYIFGSDFIQNQIIDNSQGSAMKNLVGMNIFKNIKLILPSKSEQKNIVDHLDEETTKIDLTIQKTRDKIQLLNEYKKSLIHHVVTGKVDVREVAV